MNHSSIASDDALEALEVSIHSMQFGLKHVAERAAAQLAIEFDGGAWALEVLDVGRGLVIGRADARQARTGPYCRSLCTFSHTIESTTEDIDYE